MSEKYMGEKIIEYFNKIVSVMYYFFPNKKQNIENILNKANKNITDRIRDIIKDGNLRTQTIDDFCLDAKLQVRFAQKIKSGMARVRELHSSSKKQDSEETIEAETVAGKLLLKYKHVEQNEDRWVSYVIKEFKKKSIDSYVKEGYFIVFTACSDDLQTLIFETRLPERKRYAFLTSKPTIFFCSLEDVVADIDKFEEICFVIRAFPKNKLQGTVQICNFNLIRKIKCPHCGNEYRDPTNISCRCGHLKELKENTVFF